MVCAIKVNFNLRLVLTTYLKIRTYEGNHGRDPYFRSDIFYVQRFGIVFTIYENKLVLIIHH
jgi:hypothetical protein